MGVIEIYPMMLPSSVAQRRSRPDRWVMSGCEWSSKPNEGLKVTGRGV
jgi:hypothetical protein